jgi:hypothetical protein
MKKVNLLILALLLTLQLASANSFTDEALWRASVGGIFALETFDGIAAGTDVTSLPSLGIRFGPLDDGTQPTVQAYANTGGVVKSGPNNVLNDRDFALPARGPYTMFPLNAGTFLFGLGLWNVGGDDTLRLSFYDASNNLIEQVVSPSSSGFFGITNAAGASKAVIDFVGGNGYAPIDDLQTAARPTFEGTPEPGSMILFASGLIGLGLWGRRRRRT